MAVLSVSAGLLLILGVHVRFLLQSLTESYLRLGQLYGYLKLLFQLADYHVQMLVAHAVQQGLAVLGIIDIL